MGDSLYQQVYDNLRARIESGEIALNEKLPSQEALIEEFHVSAITTRRALDMLRNDGFIVRRPKIGSIVVSSKPTAVLPPEYGSRLPVIGCVMTHFDDTFGSPIITGILNASEGTANVIFKKSLGDAARESQIFADLTSAGVNGIMVMPSASRFVPDSVMRLTAAQFPIVVINRNYDSMPVSTVSSDTFKASFEAANYLFDLGHSQLGLIEPSPEVSPSEDRYNGFVSAHAQRNLTFDTARELRGIDSVALGDGTRVQDDISRIVDFLVELPDLTAVVVYQHAVAELVSEAARQLGRSIPEDLSIICFNHPAIDFRPNGFHYTHIRQNQELMGRTALQQVIAQTEDIGKVVKHVLETTLVVGDSTAPARK